VIKFLLPLFLITSSFASSKKAEFYNLKSAKYISQLERSLRRSKVKNSTVKAAKKIVLKSTLFRHYSNDLDIILDIKDKLRKRRYFSCPEKTEFKNAVQKRFQKHLKSYCLNAYTLLINKKFETTLLQNTEDYNSAILYYIKKNNRNFLKKIDSLNKESKLYKYTKAQIISSILENGITPNKSLYTHIDFNSGLTYLLQTRLHNIKRNKLIFTQEFAKLYQDFKKTIHSGQNSKAITLSEQMLSFQSENKEYIYKKTAWKSLVITGKKLLRRKYDQRARKIFAHTISLSYDFETYNESVFQMLWSSLYKSDYKSALADIEKLKLIDSFSKLSSKVKFWIAYSLHNDGDRSIAQHLFKLIIKNNPLSYYSIISQKYLPTHNAEKSKDLYLKKRDIASENLALKDFELNFRRTIQESFVWKKLNHNSRLDLLLGDFIKAAPKKVIANKELINDYDSEELKILKFQYFMKLFKANKDFLSSFKFISKSIDKNMVSTSMININSLFPTLYSDEILRAKSGLDLNLVLSLIRQESAFNREAKSRVGARGLMQLMPYTAKRFVKYKKTDELYDPTLNVIAGTKYLKKLLKKFDGNIVLALSSYNAGPTKVARWMKNIFSSDDPILMIEEIPYKETRLYVKLIYRNLFFYSLLNDKYLLDKNLKSTFKVSLNEKPQIDKVTKR
jgi:soluble lytic murein transglycosylase